MQLDVKHRALLEARRLLESSQADVGKLEAAAKVSEAAAILAC